MNHPPPVPVDRAISIYIAKNCTWQRVAQYLQEETGHYWEASTINSAVNRVRAGIPQRGQNWDDGRIELLKELWREGKSAAVIAMQLGGLTRNAVIGMVHRLGLSRKSPAPKKRVPGKNFTLKQRSRPHVPQPPHVPYLPPPPVEYILGQGKPLLELGPKDCLWCLNAPKAGEAHMFCASPKEDGLSYCADHAARAYSSTSRAAGDATEKLKKNRTWS